MSFAVESIAMREIRLTLKEPFRISSGVVTERRIALLEIREQSGEVAWSECVAGERPNYSPETIDTAWLAIREWIAPIALGRRWGHPSEIHPVVDAEVRGHEMAKAAIEMGCWALAAQMQKVSLSRYVGGTRTVVPAGISLGIQPSPADLVERARAALSAGYQKVKIKIQPGADVEYVAAVREAVGPGPALMADANSAYTSADTAHLARLDAFGLTMIEQPLGRDDLRRHAELQRRLRTPICLDESITSVERAEDMIAIEAGRIVNIKPGRVGGFAVALAIHDLCRANRIPVWCGGMLESGIGRAYNVALASLDNFTMPGDLSPSARYWARDIVDPEWTMSADGFVSVPHERPGIGVDLDLARIDAITVRREVISS